MATVGRVQRLRRRALAAPEHRDLREERGPGVSGRGHEPWKEEGEHE